MEQGRVELIRPNGLVERLDRAAPAAAPGYRAPPPVPARALDRRRRDRPAEALWRGRLVDLVS